MKYDIYLHGSSVCTAILYLLFTMSEVIGVLVELTLSSPPIGHSKVNKSWLKRQIVGHHKNK